MNSNEICKNVAIHNTLQNNIFYKFMIPLAILLAIFITYYFRRFYINDFLKQILIPIIVLILSSYVFYQLALSTMNQNLYMQNLNNCYKTYKKYNNDFNNSIFNENLDIKKKNDNHYVKVVEKPINNTNMNNEDPELVYKNNNPDYIKYAQYDDIVIKPQVNTINNKNNDKNNTSNQQDNFDNINSDIQPNTPESIADFSPISLKNNNFPCIDYSPDNCNMLCPGQPTNCNIVAPIPGGSWQVQTAEYVQNRLHNKDYTPSTCPITV